MRLSQALGLTEGNIVAFVGAGGKTSAMAALANELSPPVVMTTTTHLGFWQTEIAGQHNILSSPEGLRDVNFSAAKTTLLTGPSSSGDRLAGLDPATLDALFNICREQKFFLLIEADGARQLPLKAPAEYEPVIPVWVDHVVVMAGLSGLGKRLDADTVHRPEIYAQLAGLPLESIIEIEHAARLFAAPNGGLKGVPKKPSRILFLNQADEEISQARGARLARKLAEVYDRVLIGSLAKPNHDGPIFSAHSKTAGIILAAGGSERLGQPKQLLDWSGVPFVVQVAQTALLAGLDPVIVVTGANQVEVEVALVSLPVRCVCNPEWASGQSTSMQVGLGALADNCDRVMFLLSDQPQLSPLLIRQLIERHNVKRAPITAPMLRDRRGNPVLVGRETFKELRSISGDQGGRGVFNQFLVDWLPWIDDRALLDVDQKGDYEKLITAYFEPGSMSFSSSLHED